MHRLGVHARLVFAAATASVPPPPQRCGNIGDECKTGEFPGGKATRRRRRTDGRTDAQHVRDGGAGASERGIVQCGLLGRGRQQQRQSRPIRSVRDKLRTRRWMETVDRSTIKHVRVCMQPCVGSAYTRQHRSPVVCLSVTVGGETTSHIQENYPCAGVCGTSSVLKRM